MNPVQDGQHPEDPRVDPRLREVSGGEQLVDKAIGVLYSKFPDSKDCALTVPRP